MSMLDSVPAEIELAAPEVYPIAVDFSPNADGDTLQSAQASVIDVISQQDITLSALQATPLVNAPLSQVEVVVIGSALTSGRRYELRTTGTFSPQKKLVLRTILWPRF